MEIIKTKNTVSTDNDLAIILSQLKESATCAANINSSDEVIDIAMQRTSIYVGEVLLANKSMLLPSVHFFLPLSVSERLLLDQT